MLRAPMSGRWEKNVGSVFANSFNSVSPILFSGLRSIRYFLSLTLPNQLRE